jgi:hypothetical protein
MRQEIKKRLTRLKQELSKPVIESRVIIKRDNKYCWNGKYLSESEFNKALNECEVTSDRPFVIISILNRRENLERSPMSLNS